MPGRLVDILRAMAVVALLGMLGQCVPPSPDASAWGDAAVRAVDELTSEVGTARLALTGERDGDLPRSYATVVAVRAEQGAADAAEGLLAQQSPVEQREEYDETRRLLGEATDLLAEVRVAVVAEDEASYDELLEDLGVTARMLEELNARLERGTG